MKIKTIAIIIVVLAVLTVVGLLALNFYNEYKEEHAPSTEVTELRSIYEVPDDEAMVIIDEKIYGRNALWRNNMAYLDLDTVTEMYIHRFFWEADENLMIYTTAEGVYHFTPGMSDFILNNVMMTGEIPVVEEKGGLPYISVEFLKECGITYSIYGNSAAANNTAGTEGCGPMRLMITYAEDAYLAAYAKEATQIRTGQDIKAGILKEVGAGELLRYIDGGGIRENGFIKVMSADGVRGYISEKALDESFYAEPTLNPITLPEYTHLVYAGKVYLGWQLIYTSDSVGMLTEAIEKAPEMNVVAPTWFFLTGTEGEMKSYANKSYVETAHERGVKVWATYKNDTIEGEFSCTEDSHNVLSSTSARRTLVRNMLQQVEEYGFDGINIDFELLKIDTGIYFIQFLRELSVECRARGIILSVDNYVPENYNAYYDLPEQSDLVDYIIIMGYDQHYAGGGEAGSVSSLDWFTNAAAVTAQKTDAARAIMAVPFYTRLWKIENGGIYVEKTPTMAAGEKLVKDAGASAEWDEDAGQYYAEWKSGGATYMIWLEEEDSLKAKTRAAREYGMAGIAAWKCGDEKSGTWGVIKDAFEGEIEDDTETEETLVE